MWILILILMPNGGNYVSSSNQYEFTTEKACNEVRAALDAKMPYCVLTKCVHDKQEER